MFVSVRVCDYMCVLISSALAFYNFKCLRYRFFRRHLIAINLQRAFIQCFVGYLDFFPLVQSDFDDYFFVHGKFPHDFLKILRSQMLCGKLNKSKVLQLDPFVFIIFGNFLAQGGWLKETGSTVSRRQAQG